MITLAEIKAYLRETTTDKDTFLKTVIPKAVSYVESYLNRKLQAANYTDRRHYCYASVFYTDNFPVNSISAIKEISSSNEETDLIVSPNTIANSVLIDNSRITLLKSYYISGYMSITYNAGFKFQTLTGTVTTTAGLATVVGVGTAFTTELAVGDFVIVEGERKQVSVITDNTNLTVSDAFGAAYATKPITLTTLPEVIKEAILEVAAMLYKKSWQGDSTLLVSSKTNSDIGGGSITLTNKDVNLNYIDLYINYSV